ncbi:MAG: Ig-like domain-containing protein [Candidatus Pacebacteria bacterium]|nr:Ig-like domain-containing protein [Candidatus Paceibacterota bacterium]
MGNDQIEATPIESEVVEVTSSPKEKPSQFFGPLRLFLSQHKKHFIFGALVILIVGSLLLFGKKEEHVAVKQFTNVYSFVPEKISKSAVIPISVPEGVSEDIARASITFSPELEGDWTIEETESLIVFQPKKPLRSGVYYAVNMDTGSVQLSGDFFVDEDPKIEAIFPTEGGESHEDSEITIVFNRPMVPLTTLTEQEKVELPINITPQTPGRFKWISTRNLQFIPETTLVPSSDYTVEIGSGMYSLDGLPVAPITHAFVTRPLRYEYISEEQIGYRSPMIIDFNQAVDLEKTAKNIQVKKDGELVKINIEYGETSYYDYSTRKYVTEADTSKLFIYQDEDTHGRDRLWDFDTTYEMAITGASPLLGNKDLIEGRNTTVSVPNIIENVTAQSERSSQVRPDLFDPQGKLVVTFYEDVDKDNSDIAVKGIGKIEYGERCKTDENGNEIRLGSDCEKEADKRNLIFTFKADQFAKDESFDLVLKKIETPDGFRINPDTITINLKTYPSFQILRTFPDGQTGQAPLDSLYVCSNVPLKEPGEEGMSSYIKTEGYIVFGRWLSSQFISLKGTYDKCESGEFETQVRYGLLPETNYNLDLSLIDDFGQTADKHLSLRTGPAESKFTHFFNMQQVYNVTPPERTKLTYAVENMEYVDMHICRLEPEAFLRLLADRDDSDTAPQNAGCTNVVTKRISLPARYFVYNYFQVDLAEHFTDTRGHYVITFTSDLYRDYYTNEQKFDKTYVSVTNLAVGKKEVEYSDDYSHQSEEKDRGRLLKKELANNSNLYWVNNSKTLTQVYGATVTQYQGGYKKDFVSLGAGVTDGQGIARLPIRDGVGGAVVRSGADTAVISDWADTLMDTWYTRDASRTYLYTDRPIYRPGQTVYVRGIDRIGFDGSYEVWDKGQVKLEVFNAKWESIYKVNLIQNEYGTFNTSFELPDDAPLGTYHIEVFGNSYWFDVEEYVPAAFKLEAESNKEEYQDGDMMKLDVQADYYFGVPLSEGTVSYSVTAQDYYFDRYEDEYFNFGSNWYYCYSCGYGDDFLFRGETSINENGRATIERELKFKDYFDDLDNEGSKLVTVFVTVKDVSGRSVSLQKTFIVHKSDFYLGAKTDQYYTGTNAPVTLRTKTVDVQGKPISISGIDRTVYKVNWETFKRQEVDGGFYYRSEKRLEQVSHEQIKTDDSGNWSGTLTFADEGEYEIHLEKVDDRGTKMKTIVHMYIYGSRAIPVPPNNNYELDLEVEKTDLEVGDEATLLIKSPYEKAKVLITAERGSIYDHWIVEVTGGLYVHKFPIKSEYAPNIFISALLLSGDPEVKYGVVSYNVGIKEHQLQVEVIPNKTHYLPGEQVTLTIETKNTTGQLVPAEVSVAVADLSVLALKGNPKKNPAVFFYDGFPLTVSTASNIKNVLYEVDIPLGTKGGGGADPDDLAKKKRGIFKDTAYWEASVVTDQNGKATVSFTLPDNLTTWQVEGLGVTKDTKLGVDYAEFTTKKDLMAVPLKPRFVVPGDKFSLGAKIFNQTDKGTEIKVELTSDTLQFTGKHEESIFINKGESKTVYFDVVTPTDKRAGTHQFTFTATTDQFVDSVEESIAITPNTTYETVATANFTKNDVATEYLYVPNEVISGEGGLTINANATMAVFMTDALTYMVTYPYGCSEQLASSLGVIGTLSEALSLPNVEGEFDTIEFEGVEYTVDEVIKDGLKRIYETQNFEGGFAYYKGLEADLSLTMHVVTALNDLKEAGYEVDENVIRRALAYIEAEAKADYYEYPEYNRETIILAEYTLRQANGDESTSLTEIVTALINDKAVLNEKLSSMTLAYLAILTAEDYSRSSRDLVYDALLNRMDIDGRGAYLSSIETANWDYFETPIMNTALLLKAFAAHKDENPEMANVLRWLLASRDHRGVWGGTHNTFVVVDAMIDYLKWQHETESHFTLRGLLDGVEIFGHEFNASNVFDTFTHFVSIDQLTRSKLLPLSLEKDDKNGRENNLYYDMTLKYFLPVESLPPRDEGVTITRELYALTDEREQSPLISAKVGDVVKGKITITIPDEYNHVSIEDMIPAGFEIVNFNLATEDQSLQSDEYNEYKFNEERGSAGDDSNWLSRLGDLFGGSQTAQLYQSHWYGGDRGNDTRKLRPTHTESHDDRVFLYVDELSEGVYEYEYYLRALVPGEFQYLPARAEEMFFPEVFGRTDGRTFTVTPAS